MPSREYMEQMLTTGDSNEEEAPAHEPEEIELPEAPEQEVSDEVATEEEEPPSEEGEGPEDAEEESPEEEQEQEEQEDTTEAAQEEEFYLGRYKSREEAEKGWLEKEQFISRQGEELQQIRQQMSEMQGYMQALSQQQSVGPQGDFQEWATNNIEAGNAWGAAEEALDASLSTGDSDYVDQYIETWREHDPYEAARFRVMLDSHISSGLEAQREHMTPPPPQEVLNQTWLEMAEQLPELKDPEAAAIIGKVLKGNPVLTRAALSSDPQMVANAIGIARDGYKMSTKRTGNGTPRKVKSSDAEQLAKDKLAATVTTGDSAPERGRASTPEVPPELQDMMQRIQQGEGGFPKLRDF